MTRFARARGSKASNERTPEDGTPWEVMKEQLLQAKKESIESKNREEAEKQRIENYENFLKDRKVQKRKATWCDFPEVERNKKVADNVKESNGSPLKSKKKKKKVTNELEPSELTNNDTNCEATIFKPKKNNKKVKDSITESERPPLKNKKKHAKKSEPSEPTNNDTTSEASINKSKKKKKPSITIESQMDSTSTDIAKTVLNNKKRTKKRNIKLDNTPSEVQKSYNVNDSKEGDQKYNNTTKPNNKQPKAKKNKKLVDGKPVRRKEINDRSFQLIVNGKEIELVRFDGFPVMKRDAERLAELKANMIQKGIPKSEVQRTMKLERRRAEKALARMKRDVCYNCRKGGHVLSDCPELKSKIPGADGADGVCFKCGSTEHRQFECKVQRDKEFRFATCFICKEPGHIARQCPDNPKGLYPNGGNCKLCGDVTHLRKDCPTVMDKKEESTVKLHTLDSSENIEDVGQQSTNFTPAETSKKPKKVKF